MPSAIMWLTMNIKKLFRRCTRVRSLTISVLLPLLSLGIVLFLGAVPQVHAAERPNVVIIYTDDQGIAQFGCYGGQPTPNIDRLAEGGVRFDRFYVSTALCAPSRYALQTGRYASAAPATLRKSPAGEPVMLLQHLGDEHNRPPERWNMPAALQAAGYRTGFVGKYHLGFMGARERTVGETGLDDPEKIAKLKKNFELAQEGCYAGGYDFADGLYHDNPQPDNFYKDVQFHNQDWITYHALRFLDDSSENSEQPFFLIVNPTLVHWPPPEEGSLQADRSITPIGKVDFPEVQPSRDSVLERTAELAKENPVYEKKYAEGVIWLDDAVGVITKKIEDLGLAENTLILLMSDHGTNGKWTCREGGIRSGGMAYWPGRIEAGRKSDGLIQNVDIAPTVLEICGAAPLPDPDFHGMSVARHLLDGEPSPRKFAYAEIGYRRAIVDDQGYKYMVLRFPEEIETKRASGLHFDLQGRPLEQGKEKSAPVYEALYDLNAAWEGKKNLAEISFIHDHSLPNHLQDPAYAEHLTRLQGYLREISARLPHRFGEFTEK